MIRPCRSEDLEAVLSLWDGFDLVHHENSAHYFRLPSYLEKLERHGKYANGEDAVLLVHADGAETPDAIGGFIAGQFRQTPDVTLLRKRELLELHAIFVKPERRGTAAKELLDAAIELGRERGVDELVCHVWAFNGSAVSLVRKSGFRQLSAKYVLPLGFTEPGIGKGDNGEA